MTKTIQTVHTDLLVLLKSIDEICIKNNIKYSLFAGTLIGAVRHKGFIPWDDDADIVFERKEYEKFIQSIPQEYILYRDPWVPRFASKKDESFYIDIFVLDSIDNNVKKQKQKVLKLKFLQGTLKNSLTTNKGLVGTVLSLITYVVGKMFSRQTKINWYDTVAIADNNKNTKFLFSSLDQFKYIGNILPKKVITSYKTVDFEDTQLMIMEGYHEYLSSFYGDYMKLPDEDKRVPEHGNV